jgi:hypothetical protein
LPTELHLALQQHYAGADGEIEVDLGRYRADVLRGGVIYEVQTGNFTAIRDKVKSLARKHSVVVVYPVPRDKLIVHIDPQTGDELRARKSPKHGRPVDIFDHLVNMPTAIRAKNVAIEIVITIQREIRQDDGQGSWRRKGISLVGHELVELLETHRFDGPRDFLSLLPEGLPSPFTVGELAQMGRMRRYLAGKMAYALCKMGATKKVGKRGNWILYRATR